MPNVTFFSPDGGTSRYPIEDTPARELIKDTVGFTGKNRAYSQTNNAVIASIESGKTYSVSWTGSATITLKKDSASGTEITSGSTSPLTFTADADYDLYFGSSDDVTQIMVCDSALDGEYEEYHDSVETMFEDVADDIDGINLYRNNANTQTINGITLTRNSNESWTISGMATADIDFYIYPVGLTELISNKGYILSGAENLNSNDAIKINGGLSPSQFVQYVEQKGGTAEKSFTWIENQPYWRVRISIVNGSNYTTPKTVYPMVYDALYGANLPYRPYNQQSIQHQINAQTGVSGAKNLWKNDAVTQASGGVTWTVNSDGTITPSGTPTENTYMLSKTPLKPGKYIINGLSGTSNVVYDIHALYKNGVAVSGFTSYVISDAGDNVLDLSGYDFDTLELGPKRSLNGVACSGTIKPMIRLASDPDDTYVPFAMTNRELTEVQTYEINSTYGAYAYKVGKIVTVYVASGATGTTGSPMPLGTLPAGWRPAYNFSTYADGSTGSELTVANANMKILADGTVRVDLPQGTTYIRSCATFITKY